MSVSRTRKWKACIYFFNNKASLGGSWAGMAEGRAGGRAERGQTSEKGF